MSFDSVTVLSMVYYGTVSICELRHPVYGSGPRPVWRRTDLICQPGPSPGIKTHSSPAAFPMTLSLPFVPFSLSLTYLHRPLVPQAALSSTYSPLVPTEPIRRG
jgi:hypothetical protein